MIDPATGWFKMAQIPNKTAAEIADIAKKPWFSRYPLPQRIVFDRGTKYMAYFTKMCQNDYGLKSKPITTRNPQSNAIIEKIHQSIKILEISSAHLIGLTSLTTIPGQAS